MSDTQRFLKEARPVESLCLDVTGHKRREPSPDDDGVGQMPVVRAVTAPSAARPIPAPVTTPSATSVPQVGPRPPAARARSRSLRSAMPVGAGSNNRKDPS
ncbi:hypothetical protein GCM10009714_18380 [Microlunatus capsulatus]